MRARVRAARVPFWVFYTSDEISTDLPHARTRAPRSSTLSHPPRPTPLPHEIGGCDPDRVRSGAAGVLTTPMPASFLHALPGLVGAWGEIWHGGALELSAFDRLAATARRPGGQKLCRSAIRRSERAGGGPPPARSAQCLQAPGGELRLRATIEHAGSLAVRESSTLHGRFDCGNTQSVHSL